MYRLTRPKLIEQFISSDVAARMAQADKRGDLYKEKPFVMDYEGVLVQGIIDVFWLENDKIVLLDYKTDRVNAAKELIDRYSTQLKLYADALGRIFLQMGKAYRRMRGSYIHSVYSRQLLSVVNIKIVACHSNLLYNV